MSECISKWISEWILEWKSEWISECISHDSECQNEWEELIYIKAPFFFFIQRIAEVNRPDGEITIIESQTLLENKSRQLSNLWDKSFSIICKQFSTFIKLERHNFFDQLETILDSYQIWETNLFRSFENSFLH